MYILTFTHFPQDRTWSLEQLLSCKPALAVHLTPSMLQHERTHTGQLGTKKQFFARFVSAVEKIVTQITL